MPTIQQLVRKGRETLVEKGKSPAKIYTTFIGRSGVFSQPDIPTSSNVPDIHKVNCVFIYA